MKSETKSNLWQAAAASATGLHHGFWFLMVGGFLWDLFMVPGQTAQGMGTTLLVHMGLVWLSGHLAGWVVGRSKAAFEAMCAEEDAERVAELVADGFTLVDGVWRKAGA